MLESIPEDVWRGWSLPRASRACLAKTSRAMRRRMALVRSTELHARFPFVAAQNHPSSLPCPRWGYLPSSWAELEENLREHVTHIMSAVFEERWDYYLLLREFACLQEDDRGIVMVNEFGPLIKQDEEENSWSHAEMICDLQHEIILTGKGKRFISDKLKSKFRDDVHRMVERASSRRGFPAIESVSGERDDDNHVTMILQAKT